MQRLGAALVIALMACSSPARTPATPPPAGDAAVKEGAGWTRSEPGVWIFNLDEGRAPDFGLSASGTGQGFERIDLPTGAHEAHVVKLSIAYSSAGPGKWTIVADEGGKPGEKVLAEIPIEISADQIYEKTKAFVDHEVNGAVNGSFWVVFSDQVDNKADAANIAALKDVDTQRLFYRGGPTTPLRPVAHLPFVRITLADVK